MLGNPPGPNNLNRMNKQLCNKPTPSSSSLDIKDSKDVSDTGTPTSKCMSDFGDRSIALPTRPRGGCNAFRKTNLVTNAYKVNCPVEKIYVLSLEFSPRLAEDNRLLRNKIIEAAFKKIQEAIGVLPVISGKNVFCCEKPKFGDITNIGVDYEGQPYNLLLKVVKNVKMSDLWSGDSKLACVPLSFLNNLLKNQMRNMGFMEIGKSRKYFDSKSKKQIAGTDLTIYQGFETSFMNLEGGIYLKVDTTNKIVRNKTVLESINEIYSKNGSLSKEDKRSLIREKMVGKCIMSDYGNSRYWRIDDILFDMNTDEIIINKDTNSNLTEYYKQKYQINITNKKQPLIKAFQKEKKFKGKEEEASILIPELMLMTGLPDDFDERLRRNISEVTIKQPGDKLDRVESMMNKMINELSELSLDNLNKSLHIEIEPQLATIDAFQMCEPRLLLGTGNQIETGRASSFQLFNKPLYSTKENINILMVYFNSYDPRGLVSIFKSTADMMKLKVNMKEQSLGDFNVKKAMSDIETLLADKGKKIAENHNLVLFVLPDPLKSQYKKLKKWALLSDSEIVTQMTLESTLGRKGFNSIATKILLQIAVKVGNTPWIPEPPKGISEKIMIVGLDSSADKEARNQSVIGICCTLDSKFSKFFSTVNYEKKSGVAIENLKTPLMEALIAYKKRNNFFPEEIVILREGVSEGQIPVIFNTEVASVLNILKDTCQSEIKLVYIIVDRKVNQKFFACSGDRVSNPSYGSLINSTVVSKNYDFYMIAQNCNRGAATPVYYKVIYNSSSMKEGMLQELIYSQCFNYMNWTGSVRVPSVCQYSRKIAGFVADNINESIEEGSAISERLFYI